jgi:hypothetical protein
MPNVRGTCAFPGCTKQQQKRTQNRYRATCGEHRGKPHPLLNNPQPKKEKARAKKRAQRELRHEIDMQVGYRATSLRQHLKRL